MRDHRVLQAAARSRPGTDGISRCIGPTHARERGFKAQRLPWHPSDRPAADSLIELKGAIGAVRESAFGHLLSRMSALRGLCCKTIFVPIMRNIDSRTNTHAHH